MKKETVSVLKPHNKNKSIKKKTSPKNVAKVVKNIVENNDSAAATRGTQKPKIVSIQSFSVGSSLINMLNKTHKPVKAAKKAATITEIQPDGSENKSLKNNAVADGKMAKLPKSPEAATRGPSKKKIKSESAEIPGMKIKNTKEKVEPSEETAEVKLTTRSSLKKQIKTKSEKVAVKKAKKIKNIEPEVKPTIETAEVKLENMGELAKEIPQGKITSRKKSSKSKVKVDIANTGNIKLTKEHVAKSVEAVLQLSEKQLKSKKSLLPMENVPVLLQITCIKVAKTPRRQIRPYLPHSLVGPLDDVAIFVPDIQKGRRQDYEKTVEHWENVFREKNVECIKEIIPLNRVLTEYSQFEMKRKLSKCFDFFLVDGRISGHLAHLLGREFFNLRCPPIPVKIMKEDLKKEFENALHKSCLQIHSLGNTQTMQVGTISMEAQKIVENIWAACEQLAKEYPGGWENIRTIYLKTNTTAAVPIYYSFVSKNKVSQPVVKPKRPKAYKTVKGELTTLPGKVTVKITPEGVIKLKRKIDVHDEEYMEKKRKNDETDKKENDTNEGYEDIDDEDDEDQQ